MELAPDHPYPRPADGCTVVHFTAAGCRFCSAEEPLWLRVAAELRKADCGVVTIVPYAGQALKSEAENPSTPDALVYAPLSLARLNLTITPTTLVLDGRHRPLWSHVGELTDQSAKLLLSAIAAAGALRGRTTGDFP